MVKWPLVHLPAWLTARRHIAVYIAAALILWLIDFLTPAGPWYYWPALAWFPVVLTHYLYFKATTIDQRWADKRTLAVRYGSYDIGHIREIDRAFHDQTDGFRSREPDDDDDDSRT